MKTTETFSQDNPVEIRTKNISLELEKSGKKNLMR